MTHSGGGRQKWQKVTFASIVFFIREVFFYRESSEFRNIHVRCPHFSGTVLEITTGYHVNVAGISQKLPRAPF